VREFIARAHLHRARLRNRGEWEAAQHAAAGIDSLALGALIAEAAPPPAALGAAR
jgi:hypothetical protein